MADQTALVLDVLWRSHTRRLRAACEQPGRSAKLTRFDWIDMVIFVDQEQIGIAPSSLPATYTGVLNPIQQIFPQALESRTRGFTLRTFSFNVAGGRCGACEN